MPLDVADGPEPVLARAAEVFKTLLARAGHPRPRPLVLVTGLPGPVDVSRGAAVKPPVMPGWDDFPVAGTLQAEFGCIEAVAAAPAILRQLGQVTAGHGELPATLDELMAALRAGESTTVGLVREVVASLVHFYNPARIVVGGGLAVPSDDMLAGIRAVVYRRALPLATRNLVIAHPVLGEWSGISGGVVLGIEHALTPDALTAALPPGRHR